jgi:hypothetical protein
MATKRQISNIASVPPRAPGVVIEQPEISEVVLEVSGTAPLIQNNFSQKAVEQMLRKHMGISVQREKKKPRQVIEDATITNTDGKVCLPPSAFKKAMITASAQVKGLKKTQLRTQLFVVGGSVPIDYKEMTPRMDMVRLAGMTRTPDVRFRPMFSEWSARVVIQFVDPISVQTVVDLLNRAGKVGVGEWRPERDGTFGTFAVTRHIVGEEIADVHLACAVPLPALTVPTWALDMEVDPTTLARVFGEAQVGDVEEGPDGEVVLAGDDDEAK